MNVTEKSLGNGARRQYALVGGWALMTRELPARPGEGLEPWWAPVFQLPDNAALRAFWRKHCDGSVTETGYARHAATALSSLVAMTPEGCRVLNRVGLGLAVELPEGGWSPTLPTLEAVRQWWSEQHPRLSDVNFEDATDVSSIGIRLAPIDVGYDIRREGAAVVVLPLPVCRVSYATQEGVRRVVSGPTRAVMGVLARNGYRCIEAVADGAL